MWEDRWIGSSPAIKPTSTRIIPIRYMQLVKPDMCVSELMTIPGKEWNREAVEAIFTAETSEKILAINPQGSAGNDIYAWDYTHTGFYTVKSGYWVQRNFINTDQAAKKVNQPSLDELYQQIWKLQTSPKSDISYGNASATLCQLQQICITDTLLKMAVAGDVERAARQ